MQSQFPIGIRLHLGYFRARDEVSHGETRGEIRARLDGVEPSRDERFAHAEPAAFADATQIDPAAEA